MGSALDLRVVAEGIERQTQVQRLRGSGCTVGQGFLFGRPQPLAEAVARLRDDRTAREDALVGPGGS
jgi:EAL domain-containing protein (putative c-di-GMP-specific phosphodiesterase class I)